VYKGIVEKVNSLQQTRLEPIAFVNNRLRYAGGPGTRCDGLYWIYTSYTEEDILTSRPSAKAGSIDLSAMVRRHSALSNICKVSIEGFRLVYNGIGGIGPKGHGGLRERILGEYRGGDGTGSLAINDSSLNDLARWRVSYVLWNEVGFASPHEYQAFSETIERLWRIHYGWPILCNR